MDFKSVSVIGLGYVGLPLVAGFARAGLRVLGVDVDASKVERLSRGESYIERVPSADIAAFLASGLFEPTADHLRAAETDAVCICVPTPLREDHTPDLEPVKATAARIGRAMKAAGRRGMLIVLESTTYPGTTEEVVLPIIESESGMSMAAGDFMLAFSPERENPGDRQHSLYSVPKVVGGATPEATEAAAALYGLVAPSVVRVSSPRVAEAAKMLENTYRAVNIALVNELKVVLEKMGVDIWETIDAAKTKPFGFQAFYPGPGMGGHCIPVDPFYLSWRARELGTEARFIELAGVVNIEMPGRVAERIAAALEERGKAVEGAKTLLLGAAYKPDVDDDRESPFYEIARRLVELKAEVSYHDPFIPRLKPMRRYDFPWQSQPLTAETLAAADAVVIVTGHSAFDPDFICAHSQLVIDTRNLTGGRAGVVRA